MKFHDFGFIEYLYEFICVRRQWCRVASFSAGRVERNDFSTETEKADRDVKLPTYMFLWQELLVLWGALMLERPF